MVVKVLKHLVFNASQLGIVSVFVVLSGRGGRVRGWAVLSAVFALQIVRFFAVVVATHRSPARSVFSVLPLRGGTLWWAEAWNIATFFFRQCRKRVEIWIVDVVDPWGAGVERPVSVVQGSEVDVAEKDMIQHIFGAVRAQSGLIIVRQEAMQEVPAVQGHVFGQGIPVANFVFDVFQGGGLGESFKRCCACEI